MLKNINHYLKIEEFILKLKNPLFYFKYMFFSILIILIYIFISTITIKNKFFGYYEVSNGFIQQLSQFNNNEKIYEKLLELSSSIYELETVKNLRFFSAEIWNCNVCTETDFPVWQINDTSIAESRDTILKNINKGRHFLILNSSLYYATVIPIISKSVNINKIKQDIAYKLIYYSKIPELSIFGYEPNFFTSFFILSLFFTVILISVIAFPLHVIGYISQSNIEKRAIFNIKNLIEHSLLNQENILRYGKNVDEKISRSIYHNTEAQILLKSVVYEEINIIKFINNLNQIIFIPNSIKIHCSIKMENNLIFSKNLLSLAFSTILSNAFHESVKTAHIYIKINQKKSSTHATLEIANDGLEIPKVLKKNIFNGFSSKSDGHGSGLKNLRKLLKDAGSTLKINESKMTAFHFDIKSSTTKNKIETNFVLEHEDKVDNNAEIIQKQTNAPFVVIIEDEELIWDAWKTNMHDAQLLFFKRPDEFFFHCDMERYHRNKFISKIDLIICDYDFGNNINLINSDFFKSLEKENEKFTGKFILCSGFNEAIMQNISSDIKTKINLFFQKRPTSYKNIMEKIESN